MFNIADFSLEIKALWNFGALWFQTLLILGYTYNYLGIPNLKYLHFPNPIKSTNKSVWQVNDFSWIAIMTPFIKAINWMLIIYLLNVVNTYEKH